MSIKININGGLLLVIAIWMLGCIREDVMLPPMLEPLNNASFTSGTMATLKGNYLGNSAIIFLNDTARGVQGEPTITEIQFIVPHVRRRTESTIYVTTEFGSSVPMPITILPPVPTIKKVTPPRGPTGKKIKITGSYFEEVTSVQFRSSSQNTWIDAPFVKEADTLKVTVPAGLNRDAADIRVKSLSGESDPPFPFTVLVPPVIKSVSTDKAGPGEIITITGADFDFIIDVRFGKFSAEIISNTSEVLTIRVPTETVPDSLYVETEGGIKAFGKKFTLAAKPEIITTDKRSGNVGMDLTITGSNFADASTIRFGNTPATIEDNTESTIKTKIPVGAQSGKIYVTGPGGTGESPDDFIIEGTPFVSRFEPSAGSIGNEIILTGFNLLAVTKAKIGLHDLEIDETLKTNTQLKVKVLTGSVTGKISITSPGGTYETSKLFTVTGSPEIKGISPTSGAPGTVVTISGINLPENPVVKFFNGATAGVTTSTSTQIVCQVPATASTGVINVNGALSQEFTVIVKPTITKIDPMKGGTNKEITITGSHLKGAIVKFFNNITATKVGTDTDAKITVRVPAGATTGVINVATTGGTVTSAGDFEIILPATITSFTPASGVAGTTITIFGTNLLHNPTVQFFNQVGATVKSVSQSQLLVDVPLGAGTGKISVKTDATNAFITSQNNFTVIDKPEITLTTPMAGTINEKVTIQGNNFRNIISVSFDGVATSAFVDTSSTRITVRIPKAVNGATSRSINVNVKTLADVSRSYTFSLLGTPTITKISPNNNPLNWAFLIEGTNLGSVKKISLGGKVPDIGTRGIDKQGYNYITTKVPKDITPSATHKLYLHYTSEDSAIVRPYNVLSAPPPGVFPPPTIILPPPIPSSYVQTDLSDYWIDENFRSTATDSVLSCYQLRAAFAGQPSGAFCIVGKFHAVKDGSTWTYTDFSYGSGSWDLGNVTLQFYPDGPMNGQVLDKGASKIVLQDQNGRQLILVGDKSNGCFKAYRVPGPCD